MDKIKKSVLSIPVVFEKTEEVSGADERYTKVKIWLMHLGKNVNGSVFEKEVVDQAIPTLQYCPIVGFVEDNDSGESDFSDHRYVITKTDNGLEHKYMGVAYGVITSSDDNNAHYEDRVCDDGETRTFLVVDGIVWNMFEDASSILQRDQIKAQSMELQQDEDSFDGYEDEDGLYHFTKFSFRASCILGEDYEPAMMNSTVEVQFTMRDFVDSLHTELNNKYIAYTKLMDDSKKETVDDNESTDGQGGIEKMPNTDFQTVLAMFSEVSAKVMEHEEIEDRWGDKYPRYYAEDIQENEIIVVDSKEHYNIYGVPFELNGDEVVIDWENSKRKKVVYEDYVDGESSVDGFNWEEYINKIEESAYAKVEEANGKVDEIQSQLTAAEEAKAEVETNYNQIKSEYDEMKPKFDEYVKEEQAREEAQVSAEKDEVYARYEKILADDPEFVSLKERKDELSVRDIVAECSILYSNKTLPELKINYSKSNKEPIVAGLDESEKDSDEDSKVYSRYGYRVKE